MTSIAKTARAALIVAILALATAGAASADAFHPDPFLQRGVAPADAFHPDPFVSTGVASAVHPDPGRIQSVPFPIREYAHPSTGRGWSHIARVSPMNMCTDHFCWD